MTRWNLAWLVVLAWVVVGAVLGVGWVAFWVGHYRGEQVHHAELNRLQMRQVAHDVEGVRTRLGRAPHHETELESLLGRPLPQMYDEGGRRAPLSYYRTGDDSFILKFELWATDDWTYDSTKPEAGWVQSFY